MRSLTALALLVALQALTAGALPATDAMPPAAEQIAAAVLAAPAPARDGAGVLGYDPEGALVTLRPSSNELLCLADDPRRDGFQAACYHRDLEPFMARGRALRAQGIGDSKARREQRWREIEAGTLAMPRQPTTLHILEGTVFDAATGEVSDPYRRWVIYVPFATAASTGLSTERTSTAPWLMVPGTPSAHIMVTPPKPPGDGG